MEQLVVGYLVDWLAQWGCDIRNVVDDDEGVFIFARERDEDEEVAYNDDSGSGNGGWR